MPKLLTHAQERELIAAAQAGDTDARSQLVLRNQGFAWRCAKKWADRLRGHDLEDIVNQCNLYLLEAIERFDLSTDNKFLTYAGWYLLKAMNDCQETNLPVRAPRNAIKQGLVSFTVSTIERTGDEGESSGIGEGIFDPFDAIADVERREQIELLQQCLNRMPERKRKILLERAGGRTLDEISDDHGVTRERIRQIETQAMDELKELMSQPSKLIAQDVPVQDAAGYTEREIMRAEDVIDQLQTLSTSEIDAEIERLQQRIDLLKRVLKLISPAGSKTGKPRERKATADGDPTDRILNFLRTHGPAKFKVLAEKCQVNAPQIGIAVRRGKIKKVDGLYEAL